MESEVCNELKDPSKDQYNVEGTATVRSNIFGRAWLPIRKRSLNPYKQVDQRS